MKRVRIITAIGTPLTGERDRLCEQSLAEHLDHQADAGIDGLLVAGTMGAQQMLGDTTWQGLVIESGRLNRGRFEMIAGVTDQSCARVLDRVEFAQSLPGLDGLMVLTPSAMPLSEAERADFYRAVADASRLPVFIYELAAATGVALGLQTLLDLSCHPNIAGVKLSGSLAKARQLRQRVADDFRVVPADPQMLDFCAAVGLWDEHLDGVFAACPHWAMQVVRAVADGDTAAADAAQQKINGLLRRWTETGQIFAAFTATMNACGIAGRYHPRPMRDLPDEVAQAMLNSPELQSLIALRPEADPLAVNG